MARVVWRNGDLNDMMSRVSIIPERMLDAAADVIGEAINMGADDMRVYIESRGTGYDGHTGRVDEGYMLGDVAASEVEKTPQKASGAYGWGVTGGPVHPYYVYQENGFRHWRSGADVPPMHALLDSFISAREKFYSRILGLVK